MKAEHQYVAFGPLMTYVDVICDDGTGPIEEYRPWLEIEAPTARAAMRVAVKDRQFSDVINDFSDGKSHPFKYVRVLRCPHEPPEHECPIANREDDDDIPYCSVCESWDEPINRAISKLDALVAGRTA